jgi:hypothetical protein
MVLWLILDEPIGNHAVHSIPKDGNRAEIVAHALLLAVMRERRVCFSKCVAAITWQSLYRNLDLPWMASAPGITRTQGRTPFCSASPAEELPPGTFIKILLSQLEESRLVGVNSWTRRHILAEISRQVIVCEKCPSLSRNKEFLVKVPTV